MAISINWGTKVISVPKADMTLIQSVPTEIRQLNLDTFRLALKDLEDDAAGMPHPKTHNHNTSVEVGGVILARVVEIINGYTVTFEDGQYAVNLVGANSNVGDVVNVNQVSVRSANSAGLQDLSTLLAASYGGYVVLDPLNGQSGTDVPIGTYKTPVDNFLDAIAICNKVGLKRIKIEGTATINNEDLSGFTVFGGNLATDGIVINTLANVSNASFCDLQVTGTLDGNNSLERCRITNLTYVNGKLRACSLNGTITVNGLAQLDLIECYSGVSGGDPGQWAVVDMGGIGNSLSVRGYMGGLQLINYNNGGDISIDFLSGRCIIDSTFISGSVTVRGVADVIDNSTGDTVVYDWTINGQIYENQTALNTINEGVKKASLVIPHSADVIFD